MSIVVRLGGQAKSPFELPPASFREPVPKGVITGGRRSMFELAAAIAATGREVELRGRLDDQPLEEICSAAGAWPSLPSEPRLPRADDTIIFPEGWSDPLYAPHVLSGARNIMMLLAPPGLTGAWSYTDEAREKPDLLTVDPRTVGRPQHFRAIAGMGCEVWTHSRGIAGAAAEAGVRCEFVGSGRPRPFPEPSEKRHEVALVAQNRWAPLAEEVAGQLQREPMRIKMADNETVIRRLGSARVLIWPSRVEGHSRVQVEARAMGTVPVALSSNPFAEGLDGGGAVLVDSLEKMAPAVEALLYDPARLESLSAHAMSAARAQVDWGTYVGRVDAALSREAARDGATARSGIYEELARHEELLRGRFTRARRKLGRYRAAIDAAGLSWRRDLRGPGGAPPD